MAVTISATNTTTNIACCDGKHPYRRRYTAMLVLARMLRNGERDELGRLNVYRCPRCRWWHVGNTTQE
jgi:hypothetical protein